jgi:predicted component of type VI protein secretion system
MLLTLVILLAVVTSCKSSTQVEVTTSIPEVKLTLTTTETSEQNPLPTGTAIHLPYNLVDNSSEYCQPPFAFLPNRGLDINQTAQVQG